MSVTTTSFATSAGSSVVLPTVNAGDWIVFATSVSVANSFPTIWSNNPPSSGPFIVKPTPGSGTTGWSFFNSGQLGYLWAAYAVSGGTNVTITSPLSAGHSSVVAFAGRDAFANFPYQSILSWNSGSGYIPNVSTPLNYTVPSGWGAIYINFISYEEQTSNFITGISLSGGDSISYEDVEFQTIIGQPPFTFLALGHCFGFSTTPGTGTLKTLTGEYTGVMATATDATFGTLAFPPSSTSSSSGGGGGSSSSSGSSSFSNSSTSGSQSGSSSMSSSSSGFVPVSRQCIRLNEPLATTIETLTFTGNLVITFEMAYEQILKYASLFPSSGLDTINVVYSDALGQQSTMTRNVTLWGSDEGWIFISSDGASQLLIASVNGNFYNANAQAIDNRNSAARATPLAPCVNPARYGWPTFIPNQTQPTTFIRDGLPVAANETPVP